MEIKTIEITPKDNVVEKLIEAKEVSEFNNMPVLIKLIDQNGKSGRKEKAYLVSRDYMVDIIGHIYHIASKDSAIFSGEEPGREHNLDFDRLKRLINSLYDGYFGDDSISVVSIDGPKNAIAEAELFPAINSKSSLSETIYASESGQLDDFDFRAQVSLDESDKGHAGNHLINFLQTGVKAIYAIRRRKIVEKQLKEYSSARNGQSSLKRIAFIESRLQVDPLYPEDHFERLAGRYCALRSRRINGKDRYIYEIIDESLELDVYSVRGHYDKI